MSPQPRNRLWGILLVVILAVSTAAIGFAHRTPTMKDQAAAVLTLAGFDIADICGDSGGPGHDDCPACHLTGGTILPDPGLALSDAGLRLVAELAAPRESRVVRTVRDPARGLRAPPAA